MKTRAAAIISSVSGYLLIAQNAFAQVSSSSASVGGGGATSSSLPSAGSTGVTYLLFVVGAGLFVFGMMKLVASFRD